MASKPKPSFWIFVFLIALTLTAFALHRAGFWSKDDLNEMGEERATTTTFMGGKLNITFYSSSAKTNWVNEMVTRFNASGTKVGGKTISVTQFHVTSGGSFDQIREGKIKPDLWSPGDESWLHMAKAYFRDVKQMDLFDEYTPLVNIPLVIAMWEPMAKVLGYPKPIGWKDVAGVAKNPKGWAALGHPEWGKFRWGHAHPDANSGFLTIISEVYAASGKTEGITPADLKNPKVVAFLKDFEGAVEHYGLSNSWIDELMHRKGPAYLSACVQYENTIIQTNEKHNNKPFKLLAIYPEEGNFWTQHPVAVLKGDWMTPEKDEGCKKFIQFLLSENAQRRAMEMGLRPILKDLEMGSPFDLEHGVIATISADRMFKVPEEGVLKRIRDLWEEVKVPATIILTLDRSGSMKGEPMDEAKAGAIQFIQSMKPRDQLEVVVFNDKVTSLTNLCYIRECGENAVEKLSGLFASGETALYDAVSMSYNTLLEYGKKNPNRRYAVMLLTDGDDTSSIMNRHDFLDSLPKSEEIDVPEIYTIAYGPEADKDLLAQISNRTNARLFGSTPEEIKRTYKELSANF
jgi:Ca-activated chloride channel family protein